MHVKKIKLWYKSDNYRKIQFKLNYRRKTQIGVFNNKRMSYSDIVLQKNVYFNKYNFIHL